MFTTGDRVRVVNDTLGSGFEGRVGTVEGARPSGHDWEALIVVRLDGERMSYPFDARELESEAGSNVHPE